MAVGDVYQFKLSANTMGVTDLNIFHYEMVAGSGGGSQQLADGFILNVLDNIAAICGSDTTFTDVEVKNLNDGTDFAVEAFSVPGARGSTGITSFLAWSFTLNTANINFRAGGKRFGSIASGDVVDNNPSGFIVSNLNACAVAIGGAVISGGNTYRPRIKHYLTGTDPAVYSYVNVANAVFHRVSTQGTRKPWVGV